ncbi:MAG: biopolymer transporter ExbD [Verrucomicrobiae bacterium]|nr:biopolymer transporter ExbD [Verrucomicrobiae bacterium]
MNFRSNLRNEPIALQLAPMIDVILFLLTFFLLTWNIARYETELDVRVPTAKKGEAPKRLPGEIVLNVKQDGRVILNRRQVEGEELLGILKQIVGQFPDQAVILRADENAEYKYVIAVLDICRAADIWNIAFSTAPTETATP